MAFVTIGNITVDAAITEGYALDAEVTTYAREDGPNVTDHIRAMPRTITLEGLVSDAPLGDDLKEIRDRETVGIRAVSAYVYAQLEAIHTKREPLTVTTSLGTYPNMVMVSCSINRDKDTSKVLSFSCSFQELVIVTNERATVVTNSVKRGFKAAKVYKTQLIKLANGNVERKVIYDNGPKAKPQYTYADGSAYAPRSGNVYEKPSGAEKVSLDKNGAGAARKTQIRKPNVPVKPFYQP